MGREVLFGNAHTRIPFPGVGAFYRALHDGGNPLFYVSSSPWNLYDVLSQFLHLHRIPAGPMDLRDWGIASSGSIGGHHGHKRAAIDRILATYPRLPFILVGDSGQEDPEIYRSVVHDHPERVLAIYIRSVVPDRARIDAVEVLGQELADHGIDLVLAHDTVDAARHAAARGWIPAAAVESVAVDRARERHESGS
jgi:phosphatidate phosphatase APP1